MDHLIFIPGRPQVLAARSGAPLVRDPPRNPLRVGLRGAGAVRRVGRPLGAGARREGGWGARGAGGGGGAGGARAAGQAPVPAGKGGARLPLPPLPLPPASGAARAVMAAAAASPRRAPRRRGPG